MWSWSPATKAEARLPSLPCPGASAKGTHGRRRWPTSKRQFNSISNLWKTTLNSHPTPRLWRSPYDQSPQPELPCGSSGSAPGRVGRGSAAGEPYTTAEDNTHRDVQAHLSCPSPSHTFHSL